MALHPTSLSDLAGEAANFRRFNRMYTRFIGTLNEGLLNSDYTLAEARVLYELATRGAPKASDIAEGLGVDPAYLSRMLGKFERAGLLRKKASEQDGRYAELMLTARGKAAFKKLNALSEEQAHNILQDLPPAARMELIHSMQTIESILMKVDRNRPPFILRPHRVGDMGWVVYRESVGLCGAVRMGQHVRSSGCTHCGWICHQLRCRPGALLDCGDRWSECGPRLSGQASERTADGEASSPLCRAMCPGPWPWATL
jgi:DNA-binding MarR family transcriptional regulator